MVKDRGSRRGRVAVAGEEGRDEGERSGRLPGASAGGCSGAGGCSRGTHDRRCVGLADGERDGDGGGRLRHGGGDGGGVDGRGDEW